ncbi:hypothetical protein [Pelagibaculum spongiae]|nr:hypothetical protein [Pelagibaculum spongiae]
MDITDLPRENSDTLQNHLPAAVSGSNGLHQMVKPYFKHPILAKLLSFLEKTSIFSGIHHEPLIPFSVPVLYQLVRSKEDLNFLSEACTFWNKALIDNHLSIFFETFIEKKLKKPNTRAYHDIHAQHNGKYLTAASHEHFFRIHSSTKDISEGITHYPKKNIFVKLSEYFSTTDQSTEVRSFDYYKGSAWILFNYHHNQVLCHRLYISAKMFSIGIVIREALVFLKKDCGDFRLKATSNPLYSLPINPVAIVIYAEKLSDLIDLAHRLNHALSFCIHDTVPLGTVPFLDTPATGMGFAFEPNAHIDKSLINERTSYGQLISLIAEEAFILSKKLTTINTQKRLYIFLCWLSLISYGIDPISIVNRKLLLERRNFESFTRPKLDHRSMKATYYKSFECPW